MSVETQSVAQGLEREHGARLNFTPSGVDLLEAEPALMETFLGTAQQLAIPPAPAPGEIEWIDRGRFGHVYGLPGYPDKCIKLVAARTMHDSRKSGIQYHRPNLNIEMRFMHAVSRYLDGQSTGVSAPTPYGVAKFGRQGTVMLQERIPESFVSLKRLLHEAGEDDEKIDNVESYTAWAFEKATLALENSPLRLGVRDMKGEGNVVNKGNLLIDREALTQGNIYIIDLIGHGRKNHARAAGITAVHLFQNAVLPKQKRLAV